LCPAECDQHIRPHGEIDRCHRSLRIPGRAGGIISVRVNCWQAMAGGKLGDHLAIDGGQPARHYNHPHMRRLREGFNALRDLAGVGDGRGADAYTQHKCSGLYRLPVSLPVRILRIVEHHHRRDARCDLLEKA
jgi:hypothetical protein